MSVIIPELLTADQVKYELFIRNSIFKQDDTFENLCSSLKSVLAANQPVNPNLLQGIECEPLLDRIRFDVNEMDALATDYEADRTPERRHQIVARIEHLDRRLDHLSQLLDPADTETARKVEEEKLKLIALSNRLTVAVNSVLETAVPQEELYGFSSPPCRVFTSIPTLPSITDTVSTSASVRLSLLESFPAAHSFSFAGMQSSLPTSSASHAFPTYMSPHVTSQPAVSSYRHSVRFLDSSLSVPQPSILDSRTNPSFPNNFNGPPPSFQFGSSANPVVPSSIYTVPPSVTHASVSAAGSLLAQPTNLTYSRVHRIIPNKSTSRVNVFDQPSVRAFTRVRTSARADPTSNIHPQDAELEFSRVPLSSTRLTSDFRSTRSANRTRSSTSDVTSRWRQHQNLEDSSDEEPPSNNYSFARTSGPTLTSTRSTHRNSRFSNKIKVHTPVEKLLKNLPDTDGLDHNLLLQFLLHVIRIREKSGCPDEDLFDCLQHFTQRPLADFVAIALEQGDSFEDFHTEVLSALLPSRIANQLRYETLNRLQGEDEALTTYVQEMRNQVEVLQMGLSERQLVDTIISNSNAKTRSLLSMDNRPRTLQGLLRLCISAQDLLYADARRPKGSSRNSFSRFFAEKTSDRARVHAVEVPTVDVNHVSVPTYTISATTNSIPPVPSFSNVNAASAQVPPSAPQLDLSRPPPTVPNGSSVPKTAHRKRDPQCFLCQQYGHMVRNCPTRPKN